MKVYDLVHRKETDNPSEYDHVWMLSEVGKGQLVHHLERMDRALLYQYYVVETREETGETLDHQNADEWLADYGEAWRAADGLQVGDIVSSMVKKYPLYQVKKVYSGGRIWLQPIADDEGEKALGPIQKGVKWYQVAKY
jgi:hypothetical protein